MPRRNGPLYCPNCYALKRGIDANRPFLESLVRGQGTLEEQLDACERILEFEPDNSVAASRKRVVMDQLAKISMERMRSAMASGDYESAESLLRDSVRYDPYPQIRELETKQMMETIGRLKIERDRPLLEKQMYGPGTLDEQLGACNRLLYYEPNHPVAAIRKGELMEMMADEAIRRGNEALDSSDYESSELQFELAMQLSPKRREQMLSLITEANASKEKRRRALEIEKQEQKEKEIESIREWSKLFRDG
jgi:tetratricopeptide (TPR) repeat protein